MPATRTGTLAAFKRVGDLPGLGPAGDDRLELQLLGELQGVEDLVAMLGVEDHRLLPLGIGDQGGEPGVGVGAGACLACGLGPDLVVGQGAAELLLDRSIRSRRRCRGSAPPRRRPAAAGRVGSRRRCGGGSLTFRATRVGHDHLAGDPAVEVDHAALAGDQAAGRLDVGREDAVGPGHRDVLAVGVERRAGPQLGLELRRRRRSPGSRSGCRSR